MSEVFSVCAAPEFAHVAWRQCITPYQPKRGNGYFSSSFPEYLVVVEGVPTVGEIRVLLRTHRIAQADGVVVAITKSDQSGQWYIGGLDERMRYDVVCRVEGYRDQIFSDVVPLV